MVTRDDNHVYRNDQGKIYIGVTSHLQIAGLVDFSMVNPVDLGHAKARGGYIHEAVRLFLNDDLDMGDSMEGYKGYVNAFIKFSKDHQLKVWDAEKILHISLLRTAGQFDFVGEISSDNAGYGHMFEVKATAIMPPTAPLQVAAYVKLWNNNRENKIFGGYGLHLKNKGTYRLYKYDLSKYMPWFDSIVRCNWNALSEGIIPLGAKTNENTHNLCKSIIEG